MEGGREGGREGGKDRQDRQTDRQTDREGARKGGRQTDKYFFPPSPLTFPFFLLLCDFSKLIPAHVPQPAAGARK